MTDKFQFGAKVCATQDLPSGIRQGDVLTVCGIDPNDDTYLVRGVKSKRTRFVLESQIEAFHEEFAAGQCVTALRDIGLFVNRGDVVSIVDIDNGPSAALRIRLKDGNKVYATGDSVTACDGQKDAPKQSAHTVSAKAPDRTAFKPKDRVAAARQLVTANNDAAPIRIGMTGTVSHLNANTSFYWPYRVRFDDGRETWCGASDICLSDVPAPTKFKFGQFVLASSKNDIGVPTGSAGIVSSVAGPGDETDRNGNPLYFVYFPIMVGNGASLKSDGLMCADEDDLIDATPAIPRRDTRTFASGQHVRAAAGNSFDIRPGTLGIVCHPDTSEDKPRVYFPSLENSDANDDGFYDVNPTDIEPVTHE